MISYLHCKYESCYKFIAHIWCSLFGVGGIGVIGSIFMYGYKPKEVKSSTDTPAQQPSATADKKNPSEA